MELSESAKHLQRHCREKEEQLRYIQRLERSLRRDLSDLGQAFRREVLGDRDPYDRPDRDLAKLASRCKNPEQWCGSAVCTSLCGSLICHGPGHQSKTHCKRTDDHNVHSAGEWEWVGDIAHTGGFDESPTIPKELR